MGGGGGHKVTGRHVDFMAAILEFLENSNTAQNQQLIKNIENVSNSMGKRQIKMHFKKFYVKIVKKGF